MTRRLVVTYLAITIFGLALLAIPLGVTNAHRERDRLLFDAERDASTVSAMVEDSLEAHSATPTSAIVAYAHRTGGNAIVVDSHGRALADSAHPGTRLDYSRRPEVQLALNGRHTTGTRDAGEDQPTSVYAAIPVTADGKVIGAVRVTYATATLDTRVREVWIRLGLLCLAVLAVVAVAGLILARSITRPIRHLRTVTDAFAVGNLSARAAVDAGPPEVRELGATFNRMAERLTRLLDEQQRFVADASHELRTPLTALRLRLENLASHVDERDRAALDAASSEVSRMSRVIDGLLLLAHDEANATRSQRVDVAAVARDRVEVWQDAVAEKDVALLAELPSTAPAFALPGTVEQLADNLIDNALAASPPGSRIVVRVDASNGSVSLHVVDQGHGLDPASYERAFDRFWRGPDASAGGSGLGLAIVRRLAESSGGTAHLKPAPVGGVDAVVVLPAAGNPS
ncbi:MAG TPA: HAMP domain-containing sensor histidine kinase [Acidimicrobiia bacterium]|nr:HAMP domain-containing sensor histidine kinase [Acidimicrobiia bacterium]